MLTSVWPKRRRATRYNRKLGLRAQCTMAVPSCNDLAIDAVMRYASGPSTRVPLKPVKGPRLLAELHLEAKETSLKNEKHRHLSVVGV